MTRARDAADNIPTLANLPALIQQYGDALNARATAGEFNGLSAAQVLYAGGLIAQPTAAAMGAYLKGLTGDDAATVLFKANLIGSATAAAMAAYLKGLKGDTGAAPTLTVRNVTTGTAGSNATFSLVPNGTGAYFVDVSLPQGAAGAGTGDMLKANNLSDLANKATARDNLGVAIGSAVQAWDSDLDAIAAFTGTNAILVRTGAGAWQALTYDVGLSLVNGKLTVAVATTAQLLAGTSSSTFLVPSVYWGSFAPVVLTDAPTIALDLSTGRNFTVTLGGNRVLAAPTNSKPGQEGFIFVVMDGTGGRTLSYNAAYLFPDLATAPSLNAAANAGTMLRYHVSAAGVFYISGGKPASGALRRQTLSSHQFTTGNGDAYYPLCNYYADVAQTVLLRVTQAASSTAAVLSKVTAGGTQTNIGGSQGNPAGFTSTQTLAVGDRIQFYSANGLCVVNVEQQ